jgi:hypothetical protein
MFAFARLSLARQFLLASFLILLIGMLVIGIWVGRQIEIGVANRTAAVTALYVDSFIAPHLQSLTHADQLDAEHLTSLGTLLTGTPLGQRIVAFKVWMADGTILYSTNPALTGRKFPITAALSRAFAGEVHTEISDLTEPENEFERGQWPRLIETYAPVRVEGTSTIVAVSEFYQTTSANCMCEVGWKPHCWPPSAGQVNSQMPGGAWFQKTTHGREAMESDTVLVLMLLVLLPMVLAKHDSTSEPEVVEWSHPAPGWFPEDERRPRRAVPAGWR